MDRQKPTAFWRTPVLLRTPALWRTLLSFVIDLLLLGLGWGLDDIPGFVANPARLAILLIISGHAVYNLYIRIHPPAATVGRRLEHVGLYRMQLMATETIYVFAPYTDRRVLGVLAEDIRWWGVALFLIATLLLVWCGLRVPARRIPVDILNELDGSPVGVPQVSTDFFRGSGEDFRAGPFRWLRYPSFLGLVGLSLGMSLAFRSGVCVIITAIMLIIVMIRAREMDEIYLRRFGSAWAVYSQNTWRILPFLY